ncbi:non-ribosomal peptide synthetase [Microcoleus sp. AR_TQ3_B6]|uniref:non-ribosomal peptide synthetase n=1 Tax=Microcoleus sp. AR_TQ3_B6 TaxID=3055284 RepID=UPI002FD4C4ED
MLPRRAVSPGYLHDPETTAAKFVNCPDVDWDRLYKTGDIVEFDPSGDLHFVGRVDRQVKVRGFRIELEEIETAMMKAGCAQAAVRVSPQGALVAYFVSSDMVGANLRDRLAQWLSDYKIPQPFVALPRLPQKPSGKVDLEALPLFGDISDQQLASTNSDAESARLDSIFLLWAKELSVSPEILHSSSNFRELGGTSLNLLRILVQIEKQYGVKISFADFLKTPTPHFIYRTLKQHEHQISA